MQVYKSFTLFNYKTIPQISNLTDLQIEAIDIVGRVLPFKANSYVVDELIDWNNIPNDPIFTLTFPRKEMLSDDSYNRVKLLLQSGASKSEIDEVILAIRMELNPNPAGQEHNVPVLDGVKLKGVQHKYDETVLFFPSNGQTCHAYCTFCFRWSQFSGMSDHKFHMKEADLFHEYIRRNPKVTDVLFTGGDPLTMSAKNLSIYIDPFLNNEEFKHVRTIRFGTKSLAYWPYRFTEDADSDELIQLFTKIIDSGKNVAIQAHFNNPIELSTDAVNEAVKRIRKTGAQIRTQSPLLKHINDNPATWAKMWQKQVDMGMIPYYMFVARDTGSRLFFELPLEQCWEIFRKAYMSVSGICRTVRGPSMSASPGKIQLLGVSEILSEKVFVLRFIQGRDSEWVHKPFFAKYSSSATWFDELEPAFNEDKFFFEK